MIQSPRSFFVSHKCAKSVHHSDYRCDNWRGFFARIDCLPCNELRYILDPTDVKGPDYPLETFSVLKEKEIRHHGEYRTRCLVLAAWDRM